MGSKARAGRILGRCHAALGESALSSSALDAALEATKAGELLFSECLTVRTRVLLGKTVAAASPTSRQHSWDEQTGKARAEEVMGRMEGGANNRRLLAKLMKPSPGGGE